MKKIIKLATMRFLTSKPVSGILTSRLGFMLINRLFIISNNEKYKKSETPITSLNTFGQRSWFRIAMYNAIHGFLKEYEAEGNQLTGKTAIEVGGSEGALKSILESFGVNCLVAPNYPEVDILQLPYDNNSFDFVVLDQVLEHVERPWLAVDEIYRVLNPGGISIVTGPFLHPYHAATGWKDYYRYTPDGWRVLFSRFEVLVADGWGNAEAVRAGWESSDIGPSPFNTPLQQAVERKLFDTNDRINYLTTWCIARKPEKELEIGSS